MLRVMNNQTRYRWMMVAVLSFVICHLSFCPAHAQTFTERLQKSGNSDAKVTVHHDAEIDKLVNSAVLTPQTTVTKKPAVTPPATVAKKPVEVKKEVKQEKATAQHQQEQVPLQTVQPSGDSLTTVQHHASRSYKTTGYRVQVFAGGNSRKDRQQAEKIGNQLRTLFPQEAIYVHFYSPRWICRMGNYKSYEEAHKALDEVKNLGYGAATIVKGKITVQY
ncbi:MAG: SPOR domain-containing protein [Prevotella sp.]|nr:SPOR domain-containing protein [Prevotella sp.]